MRFGVSIFPTDRTMQPVELGQEVEARDFESLWFPEHSHIPTSRRTPWGGVPGAKPLPEKYWRTHDQMVALAAVAATTERILLGTGVTLVAQRDPIWLAKEIATLDVISQGRVLFGIGYGWNVEEMAHHGVDFRERRRLLREKVLMMKALWTDEEASFEGELLKLEPSWSWPKPVQQPHPPILMGGGAGPKTIADMVDFCDGWMPLGRHELGARVRQVLDAVEAAGRDPDTFDLTYYAARRDQEFLENLESLGFGRAVFPLESGSRDEVLRQLDERTAIVESYLGRP